MFAYQIIPGMILILSVAELVLYGIADDSEGEERTAGQVYIHIAIKTFMLLICLLAGAQAVLLFVKS